MQSDISEIFIFYLNLFLQKSGGDIHLSMLLYAFAYIYKIV